MPLRRLTKTATGATTAVVAVLALALAALAPGGDRAARADQHRPVLTMAGGEGYWFVATDGGIFSYGPDAGFHGSTGGTPLNQPVVGMAPTPTGEGYWLVATDGGIFSFGDATFEGSTGGLDLNQPILGMAPTPTGDGYWLAASDGGIFSFGDARFLGSTGGVELAEPIVGMASTPSGDGYWLVARDGGVFTFGDATFHGSLGGEGVDDIVSIAATPSGEGYLMAGADGTVYEFGDAEFLGDASDAALNAPIVGLATYGLGEGYYLLGEDGGVFAFGAPFYGSTGDVTLNQPVVGMAAAPLLLVGEEPRAVADAMTVAEDASGEIDVLANDEGTGDAPLDLAITAPANGAATLAGDGTLTYTPAPDFHGGDSLTYSITDADGDTSSATVSIKVTPVDDLPAAAADSATTAEDQDVLVDVLANDTGLGDGGATLAIAAQGTKGTASITGGKLSYAPAADVNGTDTVTYRVTDADGDASTAAVTLTITAVDDVVDASDDAATTAEDIATVVDVDANDSGLGDGGLVLAIGTQGTKGTATLVDGGVRYAPHADVSGTDSFTYSITDADGDTDTATVAMTITAVDDVVDAVADSLTIDEDVAGTLAVLANDSGLGDGGLVVEITTQGTRGTAAVQQDGTVDYTPAANVNGTDSFTYRVTDADGDTATAVASITITPVDDGAPVAVDDAAATNEDQQVAFGVLANDASPDGISSLAVTVAPVRGTVALSPDGTATYTPRADVFGTDTFTYRLTDTDGQTDTAVVTVTIRAVNDVPVATADAATTTEDVAVRIPVLSNDTGTGDAPLSVTIEAQGTKGTAVVGSDKAITYTPAQDVSGSDAFTYRVTDGDGQTSTATVSITIAAVNDAPVAVDDAKTTAEDTATSVAVLANDSDVEGGPLALRITGQGTLGTAAAQPDGTVTYTPVADRFGSDTFTYEVTDPDGASDQATVTITITSVDDLPAAVADSATTLEDTAVTTSVLANDTGLGDGGLVLAVAPGGAPATGSVTCTGTSCTFTPGADVNGTVTYAYRVTDGDGDSSDGLVTVTITPVDDVPVAGDDAATLAEDASSILDVRANDTGLGDGTTVTVLTAPVNGTATVGSDGRITYTPSANFNGADQLTYRLTDTDGDVDEATVKYTVTPVDDVTPVAVDDSASLDEDTTKVIDVLANDTGAVDVLRVTITTQPAKGSASVGSDGSVTFTPNKDAFGTDSFTYRITDSDGQTATATVSLTVSAIHDAAPVAVDDSAETAEDQAVATNVLANDTSPDGATVTVEGTPARGTVTCTSAGVCTFTPELDYSGFGRYQYRVTDADGQSDVGEVEVLINPVDDVPVAVDDAATTLEDTARTVSVLSNDTGLDRDGPLTVSIVSQGSKGTAVANPDGTVTYTPALNLNGTDTFTYRISDGDGDVSSPATVTMTITPVSDAMPNAVNDSATRTVGQSQVVIDVAANDTGLEDGITSFTVIGNNAANGSVSCTAEGICTYNVAPTAATSFSFTYRITDTDGQTDSAQVTITLGS